MVVCLMSSSVAMCQDVVSLDGLGIDVLPVGDAREVAVRDHAETSSLTRRCEVGQRTRQRVSVHGSSGGACGSSVITRAPGGGVGSPSARSSSRWASASDPMRRSATSAFNRPARSVSFSGSIDTSVSALAIVVQPPASAGRPALSRRARSIPDARAA